MEKVLRKGCAGALVMALSAMPAMAIQEKKGLEGKWITGDFHQHSYVTDGSFPMAEVLQHGFDFGLDWQANSEHGGTSDEAGDNPRQTWAERGLTVGDAFGSPNPFPKLWRWQTLADEDKVPAYLDGVREANSGKIVINGMEMNMPGAEHCSTAIVDPTGLDIAQFEYLWDANDKDTSGGYDFETLPNGVIKIFENDLAKAAEAAAWMQEHFAGRAWMIPAHPERAADKDWSDGNPKGYGPNFLRTLNDAGPDVVFAFESAPGHQKSSDRGGYGSGAFGGGTYGGVGAFAATVGGLWDALLGEGREFWLVANSDFHSTSGDFWPGEYQKTYSYMTDANGNGQYDGEDVVASMRSGNMFIVHGDLINKLDFRVFHGNAKKPRGKNNATMGETLVAEQGDTITVRIRFKSPDNNNNCKAVDETTNEFDCEVPEVRHVQLISGEVNGRLAPGSEAYTTDGTNPTSVVATYDQTTWTIDGEGYTVCEYRVKHLAHDMYFRVRGNNLPPNTEYETDELGNPLPDNQENLGLDGADEAWADLWFYSNPIFIDVR